MIPPYQPPVCACVPACMCCGYPEIDHPIDKFCGRCDAFIVGPMPPTHYHETHPQTPDSPAEGIDVCEQCGRERV